MKITYTAMCPTCKESNKESRLHRDLSEPEKISCAEGHSFSGPTIEDYITVQEDAPVKKQEPFLQMPSVPKETIEDMERGFERAAERSGEVPPGLLEMTPPPGSATAKAVVAVEEEALSKMSVPRQQQELAELAVTAPQPSSVAVLNEPVKVLDKVHVAVKPAPGGALEVTVMIPDPHASFLQGEAEFRGKSVAEHFSEMIQHGLDARWFYVFVVASLIGRHIF